MTINEYQKKAERTINHALTQSQRLQEGLLGLNSEAGEAGDILKKHLFQGHELDKEHLIEELGDACWYLSASASALGIDLEEVFARNLKKLEQRYPNGFESEKSVNREVPINIINNDITRERYCDYYECAFIQRIGGVMPRNGCRYKCTRYPHPCLYLTSYHDR